MRSLSIESYNSFLYSNSNSATHWNCTNFTFPFFACLLLYGGSSTKSKLCVLTFIVVRRRVNDDEIARDNNILTHLKWARVFSTQIYVHMANNNDKREKRCIFHIHQSYCSMCWAERISPQPSAHLWNVRKKKQTNQPGASEIRFDNKVAYLPYTLSCLLCRTGSLQSHVI